MSEKTIKCEVLRVFQAGGNAKEKKADAVYAEGDTIDLPESRAKKLAAKGLVKLPKGMEAPVKKGGDE